MNETESQIVDLRENPAYLDSAHPQHRDVQAQITELYKVKAEAKAESGDSVPSDSNLSLNNMVASTDKTTGKPSGADDLVTQVEAELDKLQELGVDVSNEDKDSAGQPELRGYQRLRLIEENKFQELAGSLSASGLKAGLTVESMGLLHQFLKIAQPDDVLTKDILRVVSSYIYRSQKKE